MRKIALIAGCSHSAGSEIDGTVDSRYNRDHSFGNILANKLGYEPINIAISGATNSGIARSIQRWFKEHYDNMNMEVFAIVSWTEGARLEVPSPSLNIDYLSANTEADWYDTTAGDYYRLNFGWNGNNPEEIAIISQYRRFMIDNPILLESGSIMQILSTQYFLKSLNVEYVMCHTMHLFSPEHHTNQYVNLVDRTRYYELDASDQTSFYWKYRNLGYTNEKAKYWHHGEEPHRLHAEALYTFIKENNNVII